MTQFESFLIQKKQVPYGAKTISTNGIFFIPIFSKKNCFVCLLLMSKLKGSETNCTSLQPGLSYQTPQKKYDVFVNYRGADIRRGFLSHLMLALSQKQITVFEDDKIERGELISQALFEAIETSLIALIIFSQNYASSHWCLEELVKIIEWRVKCGQIVVPVFYNVDPTDVRHQMGTYENAFVGHEKKYSLIQVQEWRFALKESSNLAAFHSLNFRNDAELLEAIVKSVSKKLNHLHQVNSKGLGKLIAHCLGACLANQFIMLGIWE